MIDERFYGIAANEVSNQNVDQSLFAKCFAQALGEADKTKALYISARAERLAKVDQLERERSIRQEKERKVADKRREKEAKRHRFDALEAKLRASTGRSNEGAKGRPLPNPDDFSDPKHAEAVRKMLAALKA